LNITKQGFSFDRYMMFCWSVLTLLFLLALSEAEDKQPVQRCYDESAAEFYPCPVEENGSQKLVINPLQRALMKLKDAYSQPDKSADLCQTNLAIKAECDVCHALDAGLDDELCCRDVSTLTSCHSMVEKVILDIASMQKGRVEETVTAEKRYGAYRYGNLYSKTSAAKQRYPSGMGMGKRYGNLYGGFGKRDVTDTKSADSRLDKRYGFTFSKLFKRPGNH